MKRIYYFISFVFMLTAVCVPYAEGRVGSEYTDDIQSKLSQARSLIKEGNVEEILASIQSVNKSLKALPRIKYNRKNYELLLSLCKQANELQEDFLIMLWKNSNYKMIQDICFSTSEIPLNWSTHRGKQNRCYVSYNWDGDNWYVSYAPFSFSDKGTESKDLKEYLEDLKKLRNSCLRGLELKSIRTSLSLMNSDAADAARAFWKWYELYINKQFGSDTIYYQEQYKAKYFGKYGWDLYKIYGPMYSVYATKLIEEFWLKFDGRFSKLCDLDKTLAAKYAKQSGKTGYYAQAIHKERPEEAFELTGNKDYLKYHQTNLKKWGMDETEYQKLRSTYFNWDSFYADMLFYEDLHRMELQEQERKNREAREREYQREYQRKQQAKERDKIILAEYKPNIIKAMSNKDYKSAERLASEALGKMSDGDAYLYYVEACAIYKNNLDFNLGIDEDATDYFKAYRSEAQKVVNKCTQSIQLDPSVSNDAYLYRGLAHIILGNTDKAISDFKNLTSRGNENAAVSYYNIGIASYNARRWNAAIDAFKEARSRSNSEELRSDCLTYIKKCQQKLQN